MNVVSITEFKLFCYISVWM